MTAAVIESRRITCAVLVHKHPIGIILRSNTLKGIRFDMSKEHWRGSLAAAAFDRLPERVVGSFETWAGRGKDDGKVHIEWESDGRNSDEYLSVLLRPKLGLTLLPSARGRRGTE